MKNRQKKVKEVTSIVCNKCGRVYSGDRRGSPGRCAERGQAMGIFSDKDNRMDHFDLCEACYDELTGSFKIKLEEE